MDFPIMLIAFALLAARVPQWAVVAIGAAAGAIVL
jgi:hypothetical protein